MDAKDLEKLQDEASGQYLEGRFDEALATWRKLLELQPDHEEALEGVRLCEQLSDGAAGEPDAPADEGLERAIADLDGLLDLGPAGDARISAIDDLIDLGGPADDGDDAVDFGQLLTGNDGESTDASNAPGPEPAAGKDPGQWQWGNDDGPGEADVADDPVAGAQLRWRVNELLASALVTMEEGRKDDALEILNRLLVIDEENEAALSLKAKLGPPDAPATGPADEPHEDLPLLDTEPGIPIAAEEAAPSDVTSEPDVEPLVDSGPPDGALPVSNRARTGMIVGGIQALGLLFLIWRGFSAGGTTPEPMPAVTSTPQVSRAQPGQQQPSPAQPAVEDPVQPPVDAPDTQALMQQATEEFDGGNYAAALITFDHVLKIDPGNARAKRGMQASAERYREEKAERDKWGAALQAFEEGNYSTALRVFYRMPDSVGAARIERYKFNGWYNYGVQALKAGDCRGAVAHLHEARQLRPGDDVVLTVLDVAENCSSRPTESFARDVARLSFRGLND